MSIFSFKSVGHFFATGLSELHAVANYFKAHEAAIDKGIDTVAAIVSIAAPQYAAVAAIADRAGKSLLGDALAIVVNLDEATAAKGANLVLDAATIASLKQLHKDLLSVKPELAAVPAGVPVTAAS